MSAHQVKTIEIASTQGGTSSGTLTDGKTYTVVIPPQAGPELLTTLQNEKVQISSAPSGNGFGTEVLIYLIIFGLPFVLFVWLFRRLSKGAAGGLQGVMGVGRSKAKVFDEERPTTTFADVAGYEGAKAEICEVVDFLKQPRALRPGRGRWRPRGVLMVGPPGTGKTLLARAVAGEAHVPFFSVTGSSFVEMFVGVGAARVRDLFAEARKRAPGDHLHRRDRRHRPAPGGAGRGRRQRRAGADAQPAAGRDGRLRPVTRASWSSAATNRPEVLDPALLRPGPLRPAGDDPAAQPARAAGHPGRALPGQEARPPTWTWTRWPGAPPASPAPTSPTWSTRRPSSPCAATATCSPPPTSTTARDRIILGRREGSNVLLPEEKHAVAVHEAGHALVAALSEHADPVAKVTILPAGPGARRHRAAARWSSGTCTARTTCTTRWPCGSAAGPPSWSCSARAPPGPPTTWPGPPTWPSRWCASSACRTTLGPIGYPEGGSVFLGGGGPGMSSRPFAEATQAAIDGEVSQLLRQAEQRAVGAAHRSIVPELDSLVSLLLERETVDGADVYRLTGQPDRGATSPPVPPMTVAPRAAAASDGGAVQHAAGPSDAGKD